jgi:hypothetical protein
LSDKPVRWDYLNDARRKHIYNVYSRLIQLRFHPWYKGAFMTGTINQNVGGDVAVKWISVTTDTSKLLVVGNFDVVPQTSTVTFPAAGTWYDYLDSATYTATGTAQNITLQPGEFHVFVNRNVNNNSATAIASVPWNGGTLNVKVFPNPVVGSYLLEVNTPQSGTTTIELFSAMGQYMTTLYNGFLQKGTQQLSMKGLNVAKGSYYLRFTTKTATKTILITVQ